MSAAANAEAESPTVEGLRWSLYDGRLETGSKLPTAWNTSFKRAVDRLEQLDRVTVTPRPLLNFEECVQHYPGKTLSVDTRSLRMAFLPPLLEWSREKGGLSPKYGRAANELHQLRLLQKDRPRIESLRFNWKSFEDRLRPIYGNAPSGSDELLRLICKGRDLFGAGDVHVTTSFAQAVESACDARLLPAGLAVEMRRFAESFIPGVKAKELKFRSIIHELANVPRSGQCSLRTETLEFLHKRCTDRVEAMNGFARRKGISIAAWDVNPRFEYPPPLRKLFDHAVFRSFDFIAVN